MGQPSSLPFDFREQRSFARDRENIVAGGVSQEEFDEHLFAIQDAIGVDPEQEPWSQPIPSDPGQRVAVSSATPARPNALLVVFRVEGNVVLLQRASLRADD